MPDDDDQTDLPGWLSESPEPEGGYRIGWTVQDVIDRWMRDEDA